MTRINSGPASAPPPGTTAALALADGSLFWGRGIGAPGECAGELCFNTAMTGYQEILTDPSYAGQIVTFTFPHIGNTGVNPEDEESAVPAALGCVLGQDVTEPSSYRARSGLPDWLAGRGMIGITGVDTRHLTRRLRENGAQGAVLRHDPEGHFDPAALRRAAHALPGLAGMDLTPDVSRREPGEWTETVWTPGAGYGRAGAARRHVAVVDYGVKRNILRLLAAAGCRVTVFPAAAPAADILAAGPDGVMLSNGPGDPAATLPRVLPVIRGLLDSGLPLFGICLGHQLLALALGARTAKMPFGHRGANHPVRDLTTGKIEIVTQNHGFVVDAASLPDGVEATHFSLFDGTLAGLRLKDRPVFSVQYHPEASPGPMDSRYLFDRFVTAMDSRR